jgi:hypothetical protein
MKTKYLLFPRFILFFLSLFIFKDTTDTLAKSVLRLATGVLDSQ